MKIPQHNPFLATMGTGLLDAINISYRRLVELFGEPDHYQPDPDDNFISKVDAEWMLQFDDGTVATIYNYKNGENYLAEDGVPVEYITDWNIGGCNRKAADLVINAINYE